MLPSATRRMFLATTAGAGSVALGLSACGESSGGGSADTIELWMPTPLGSNGANAEAAAWKEIVAPFEQEHGVTVNLTSIPWESYEEKYLTGVASGDGPDVGYMYTEMMGDYIAQGALVPFDEHLDSAAAEKMLYLDQGQFEGQQYALPIVVGGIRLLYGNMDLLKSVGYDAMPTTWDEFIDAATKVSESGSTGFLQEWGQPDRGMLNGAYFPYLWQAGGTLFTEDGTATTFNSPAGVEAATFIRDLLDSGAMPSTVSGLSEDDIRNSFISGDVAFVTGTDATYEEFSNGGFELAFVRSLEKETGGTFVASDSLVLFENAADKELCSALVQHLLAGPQMEKMHTDIVPYPPIGSDETVSGENRFTEAYSNSELLHSLPIVASSAGPYNALYANLQQMVLGQKSPEQALTDAAAEGDSALSRN